MKVELTSVSESISLDDGSTSHSVFIELPGRVLIELQADEQTVNAILRSAGEPSLERAEVEERGDPPLDDPTPPIVEPVHRPVGSSPVARLGDGVAALARVEWENANTPAVLLPVQPQVAEVGMVDWQTLPDDVLSPKIKEVLRGVKAAARMPYEELLRVAKNVTEMLGQQSSVGQIQWEGDRRPLANQRRPPPQRTVDKDEMGYPIVDGQPGEPVEQRQHGDHDEDGVPQL
jgi:hypothetical protein